MILLCCICLGLHGRHRYGHRHIILVVINIKVIIVDIRAALRVDVNSQNKPKCSNNNASKPYTVRKPCHQMWLAKLSNLHAYINTAMNIQHLNCVVLSLYKLQYEANPRLADLGPPEALPPDHGITPCFSVL